MLRINSVQLNFGETGITNVNIYFNINRVNNAPDQNNNLYLNGNVTVPFEEYTADTSINGLKRIVRNEINESIDIEGENTEQVANVNETNQTMNQNESMNVQEARSVDNNNTTTRTRNNTNANINNNK